MVFTLHSQNEKLKIRFSFFFVYLKINIFKFQFQKEMDPTMQNLKWPKYFLLLIEQ